MKKAIQTLNIVPTNLWKKKTKTSKIVPSSLEKTKTWKTSIKVEKEDESEFKDWASEYINRPIPPDKIRTDVEFSLPPDHELDLDIQLGRFTWKGIAGMSMVFPCLFREGVPFCCVRIFQSGVVDLLQKLPKHVLEFPRIKFYQLTQTEAGLLNHINQWHCDAQYGTEAFTTDDNLMTIPDMEELYKFLKFAEHIFANEGQNKMKDFSKCGFLEMDTGTVRKSYAYAVMADGGGIVVPTFYFKSNKEAVKEKSIRLEGFELAYIKLCCQLQNKISKRIYRHAKSVIKLADLESLYPKETKFLDKYWPKKKKKPCNARERHALRKKLNQQQSQLAVVDNVVEVQNSIENNMATMSESALEIECPQYSPISPATNEEEK